MASRNKGIFSLEFLVPNVFLLIIVVFAVEAFYRVIVRPRAAELMLERQVMLSQAANKPHGASGIQERPVLLIIKDREPETEVMFFLWGTLFLAYKFIMVERERKLLQRDFVPVQPGERIIPEDSLDRYKELKTTVEREPHWRGRLLPECLLAALHRFHATNSIQDASAAVRERADLAADQLDSSLSLIRYIAWSIPAIGFVGTVRGIGDALSFAEEAIKGNLSAVTTWLGLAFNSTLVGLMLCIVLMYLLHIVQSSQEALIIEIQKYARDKLVDLMKVPIKDETRELFS
ncbi:MAG TPA: MotA/TolQ/ExbB proton channel family protein [Lacunisphaera sp.]|jgi:biopolymer transport protein ExbB/TolQ|nr:MotA/TolQ/ExbB proton channel family protein [Lacunisphaera sp.]